MSLTPNRAGHFGLLALYAAFVVWFAHDAWQASPTLVNMLLLGPVSVAALVLIAILAVRLALNPDMDREGPEAGGPQTLRSRYGVFMGCLMLAIYVVSLEIIGFDVASVLFCVTTMVMMGQRNWPAIAAYSLITGLGPVYALVHLMGVPAKTVFLG